MKQLLLKIIKIFLLLTIVLLGLLLIFGICMYAGWSWWAGVFILVGLLGLGIGIFLLKKVLSRRKEQLFVNQVVEQDDFYLKDMGAREKERYQELQDRWKEAVNALKHSHLKKLGNPLYVLPWYMVIGESGSGKTTAIESARLSSPFAEVNRTSGLSGTRNCDWWFFEQAVLIDTAGRYAIPVDEGRDKEEWQKFLTHLAKFRKKEPLNGLVVTVSADKLLESGPEALEEDGKSIRRRVDELMRVLGAKFPIYIMVTKCDLVQGMNQFCGRLSEKTLDQPMGLINQDLSTDLTALLDRTVHYIGERLRDLRLLMFHKAEPTVDHQQAFDPGLLIFPEEFERVKPGMMGFIRGAFQENPFQETPLLRGIFFSSGRQEGSPFSHFLKELGLIAERDVLPGTNKGLFLHDFFARIIPRDRKLFVPTQQALNWNRLTRNLGLTSWLALGVSICGLLSYAFVKNLWTLRDIADQFPDPPVIANEIVTDVSVMDRYRQAISDVSKKNRNWWIPRFGLNQSQKVEHRLKQNYCEQFKEMFQTQFADRLSLKIANFSRATPEGMFAIHIPYLVRRINLLQSRLKGADRETLQVMPQPPFEPLALAAVQPQISDEIANRFESLYLYYLVWQTDKNYLKKEMKTLQDWLEHILTLQETNLNWLVFWVDRYSPVKPIGLEDLWGVDGGSSSLSAVKPAFTLAGKEQIDKLLLETENALLNPLFLANKKFEFEGWYQKTYIRAWEDFITDFPQGVTLLKDEVAWQKVAAKRVRHEGPYFTLLDIMADNLRPLASNSDALPDLPVWIKLAYDLESAQKGEKLLDLAESIPGSGRITDMMTAKKAYHAYQSALAEFAPSTSSRKVAFEMANQVFKKDADLGNTAYFKARAAHDQLKATLTMSGAEQDIFWPLMSGPLDFLGNFISEETACHLNTLWDDQVRVEIQGISNRMDLSQLLFGPDGHAVKFIKGSAEPFVARKFKKGYHAKTVRGLSIPFKESFLAFMNKGDIAGRPLQDAYKVKFVGRPTSANANARIKPSATLLELECGDESQRLINRHYPIKKTFIWSPKNCGDVLFQIDVGKLKLTKNYSGNLAFAKFLKDFAKGAREFKPEDFPDKSAALKRLNVKFIKVEYKLSRHWPVINLLQAAPGKVPSTIARCWDQ